jgi:hypothetical protein
MSRIVLPPRATNTTPENPCGNFGLHSLLYRGGDSFALLR